MLNFLNFDIAFDEELTWLCNVQQSFSIYTKDTQYPGWAMHHSHFNGGPKQPPGINTSSAVTRKSECVKKRQDIA